MAGKTMELAIAIKGKLDGALPASLQKTNSEISQLSSKIRAMKSEQASYDAALRKGLMSQETYNSVTSRMAGNVNSAVAMQTRLKNSVIATNNTARSMGGIGGMFTAPFSAASGAISGLTGKLAMCQEKIMGFAALAAGGFGLASLVGGAAESGEAVYQLSTKLHMSAGEAGQFKRVLSLTGADADSAAKAIARMDKSAIASGKSGDEMRATLEGWGVVVTDSEGKLLPVNEQLKNLAAGYKIAAGEGMEQEFVMATLGTKGMELAKTLQNYDEASVQASKVKSVGMDPKKMHELYQQIQQMKMQAGQFGLVFASALAPIAAQLLPPIMDAMTQIASVISQNKDVISQYVIEIMKIGAAYVGIKTAIGTVTGVMGGAASAVNLVKIAFTGEAVLLRARPGMWLAQKAAMAATRVATIAMSAAQVALNAIMSANPLALAILAFLAFAAVITYLWNTNETFRSTVIAAWEAIKSAAMTVWTAIASFIQTAISVIGTIASVLVSIFSAVWSVISAVAKVAFIVISVVAFAVIGAIVTAIQVAGAIISVVWSVISAAGAAVWSVIGPIAMACIDAIVAGLGVLASVGSAIWDIICAAASVAWSIITAVASGAWSVIMAIADVAAGIISAIWDVISSAASSCWDMIVTTIQSAWDSVMSIIDDGVASVMGKWEELKNTFSSPIQAVVNFVKGGDSEAQSGAADAGYSARGGIFSSPYLTWVAEAGSPEAIVPLDGSSRAMGLWQQAGRMLGALPAGSPAMSMVAGATPLAATMAAPAPMANISQSNEAAQSINMTFNPTINVSGGTGADVSGQIRAALAEQARQFQEQLPRMMADIHAGQRRLSYE